MNLRTAFGVLLGILSIVGGMLIINEMQIAGAILLALIVSVLIFSFRVTTVLEVAMLMVLGKPIKNLKPGPCFAPPFLTEIRKEGAAIFQNELPADPEKIFRGEGTAPDGMFPPIRIKFGQPDPSDTALVDDPYNVPMVAEVVPVVSWKIVDATKFFTEMKTVENCRQNLADLAVTSFGDDLAGMTPAKASQDLKAVNSKLKAELEEKTAEWGIEIKDAFLKPFIYSHGLNKAVEGVSIAGQEAKATVLTSEGDKVKEINRATAAAEGVRLATIAEKNRLTELGLVETDNSGKIIKLVPDANTKAQTDALAKLAQVKGTLVLGDASTMLGIGKKEG